MDPSLTAVSPEFKTSMRAIHACHFSWCACDFLYMMPIQRVLETHSVLQIFRASRHVRAALEHGHSALK